MSIPRKLQMECPECGKSIETIIFESLNTNYASNTMDAVVNGEQFNIKCPYCGFEAGLEYDLLYHDMIHNAVIWVVHKNNPEYNAKINEIRSTPYLNYSLTRIVPDMDTLQEKAACLVAGRDDRIIELCKVFLASQVAQKFPDFNATKVQYTFSADRDEIHFFDIKRHEIKYDVDGIYRKTCGQYENLLTKKEKEPYLIIDHDWATDIITKHIEKERNKEHEESTTQKQKTSNAFDNRILLHERKATTDLLKKAVFCRKCGLKLLPDSMFCSYCGTKVVY